MANQTSNQALVQHTAFLGHLYNPLHSTQYPISSCPPPQFSLLLAEKKMARRGARPSASLLFFSLGLVLLYFTSGNTIRLVQGQKTWCVAKPSADDATLQANLNFACSQVSCKMLQKGGPCFNPDNLVSHASVAMNLYYTAKGRNPWNCNFKNSALVVTSDPSYGSCTYF